MEADEIQQIIDGFSKCGELLVNLRKENAKLRTRLEQAEKDKRELQAEALLWAANKLHEIKHDAWRHPVGTWLESKSAAIRRGELKI